MSGRKQVQKRSKSAGKAPSKAPPGKRKRGAVGDTLPDFDDQQDAFHESDKEKVSDDESDEEIQETAEEKRLRLGESALGSLPAHAPFPCAEPACPQARQRVALRGSEPSGVDA